MKLLPTYVKLPFRRIFECDICGARIHLRRTMDHSNWHLWVAAPGVADNGQPPEADGDSVWPEKGC